jgi:serine/threonine protein kinase
MLRFTVMHSLMLLLTNARKYGEDGYEGFPIPGETVISVGGDLYKIKEFLGSGPKKRAYRAKRMKDGNENAREQAYSYSREIGQLASGIVLPEELVVKCSATDQPKRINKLEDEFKSLLFLNRIKSVRKPVGLYLSKQWKCFEDSDFVCQYLVMTMASLDLQKLVSRNLLDLRSPVMTGFTPNRETGSFSFELFLATFSLSLLAELEKLHAVGIVHRDISVKNVALDPSDKTLVHIIDLGSSSFLTKYSDSLHKLEGLVQHDFDRVKRVSLQLIELAAKESYQEFYTSQNELAMKIASTNSLWGLRINLLSYLKEKFPAVQFDGKIVYA